MAVVTGEMQGVTGRVGNMVYYQQGGKTYARKAHNAGKRDMNAPGMVRVKENNQEFALAGKAGKVIRLPFAKEAKGKIAGELQAKILELAKTFDTASDRGQRNLANTGAEVGRLKGFEFNPTTRLDAVMLGGNAFCTLSASKDSVNFGNDAFVLNAPNGATHYSLDVTVAQVVLEKELVLLVVQTNEPPVPIPADSKVAQGSNHLDMAEAQAGTLVLASYGISFYQEVNGKMYKLNEGLKNPACLKECVFA